LSSVLEEFESGFLRIFSDASTKVIARIVVDKIEYPSNERILIPKVFLMKN